MFDFEELKNLREMQAQTVHCLWHWWLKEKTCWTWKGRARYWNF